MVPVHVANSTRSAARGGALSVHRMEIQMERLKYLAEKAPVFSPASERQRENTTCRYIRDHLYPLLDEPQKRLVLACKVDYRRAMGKAEDAGELLERMGLLDGMLAKLKEMGSLRLGGEAAHVWGMLLAEAEALVLKKRGTASMRLFVEGGQDECICLAEKSLQCAVGRWEAIGNEGADHAKALYWLSLAKYARGKDEEAAECAQKCMEMCSRLHGLEWLQETAKDVLSRAKMEIYRERLTC